VAIIIIIIIIIIIVLVCKQNPSAQWSFRKTGTMGTLASQAGIFVCVQTSGALLRRSGIVRAKSCNLVHFWPDIGSYYRPYSASVAA